MDNIKRVVVVAGVLCVLMGVGFGMQRSLFEKTSYHLDQLTTCLLYPVLKLHSFFVEPVKSIIHERNQTVALQDRLTALESERDALRRENIELHSMLNYAADIKELTAFKKKYDRPDAVISRVLTRVFSDDEHYCFVDAGSSQGITVDMIAVYEGCLVGRVETVYPWYAKVRLITDKSCKVAAYCAGSKVQGVYEGCNNHHHAALYYVSHLAPLKEQDTLLSSGEGLIFPPGLALGKVSSFEENGLYQSVAIKPMVDLKAVRYCLLMSKGSSESSRG
jgi:rod shape-determining protein MreC